MINFSFSAGGGGRPVIHSADYTAAANGFQSSQLLGLPGGPGSIVLVDQKNNHRQLIVDNSISQQSILCYPLLDEKLTDVLILQQLNLDKGVRVQMMANNNENVPLKMEIHDLIGDKTGKNF